MFALPVSVPEAALPASVALTAEAPAFKAFDELLAADPALELWPDRDVPVDADSPALASFVGSGEAPVPAAFMLEAKPETHMPFLSTAPG